MNVVEPIRDKELVGQIIAYYKGSGKLRAERDALLFTFGIYTGLRITDILSIKKHMVSGTHLVLREKKTRKAKRIILIPALRRELKKYVAQLNDDDYLFYGSNRSKPISRVRAYQILNEAAEKFGLNNIGTHTMRKTFGYHFYKEHGNAAMLQDIFNHSSEHVTKVYIGVNQDAIDEAMLQMKFPSK